MNKEIEMTNALVIAVALEGLYQYWLAATYRPEHRQDTPERRALMFHLLGVGLLNLVDTGAEWISCHLLADVASGKVKA